MTLCALALATGCGGSGNNTSKTGGVGKATIARAKHDAAMALSNCQQAAANSGITATEKSLLQTECTYIRTGNSAGLKTVGRQLCLLDANHQPKGARARVRAGCPK